MMLNGRRLFGALISRIARLVVAQLLNAGRQVSIADALSERPPASGAEHFHTAVDTSPPHTWIFAVQTYMVRKSSAVHCISTRVDCWPPKAVKKHEQTTTLARR